MTNASTAHSREPIDTQVWMRAVAEGDAARVKSLLAAGADVNAVAEGSETALMRAASKGHLEVVQVLLDAGGDVHARSENGFTPLFMAVFFGHADVVRALLARGSDPSAPVRLDMTAEKWAGIRGSAEIKELLKSAEAVRPQGSAAEDAAAGSEQADARPLLFPDDGQFRTVVPLSEIDEALQAGESAAPTKAFTEETGPKGSDRAEVRLPAQDVQDDEQDETTLVPARVSRASPPRPSPVFQPKGVRHSWAVTAVALVLSVIAGLIAGTYLIGSKQSVEILPSAVPSEDGGTAPGVETQAPAGSATAASDLQPSQPVPASSGPTSPAELERVAASDTHATNADEAEAEGKGVRRVESSPKLSTGAAASRHPPADEPPNRRVTTEGLSLESTDRAAGRIKDGSPAMKSARRDTAQAHGARFTEGPLSDSAPPEHSLPISSPPPSAKSRKVIQWP